MMRRCARLGLISGAPVSDRARSPENPRVTSHQTDLTDRTVTLLANAGIETTVELREGRDESWYQVELVLPREPDLEIEILVASDTFELIAGGADLRLQMQDAGGVPAAWVELALRSLEALLAADLRIRVRRTLWGGKTGAIWVPAPGGGAWSGDLFACLGMGKEHRFRPWPVGRDSEE